MRSRWRAYVRLIATVLLLLGGSGVGLNAPAAAAPTRQWSNSNSLYVDSAGWLRTSTAVDPFRDDLGMAITAVNHYWAVHWSDLRFPGSYPPPRVYGTLGLYNGRSPNQPWCDGKPFGPNNAKYCRPAHFVAWDETFMRNGYAKGDGFVYLAVAHEWGHAIQNRIQESVVAVQRELQADCLAGAALYGSARDGRLQFEAGDEAEIERALIELADDTPWTTTKDHGNASQRMKAFRLGATNGVPMCLRFL